MCIHTVVIGFTLLHVPLHCIDYQQEYSTIHVLGSISDCISRIVDVMAMYILSESSATSQSFKYLYVSNLLSLPKAAKGHRRIVWPMYMYARKITISFLKVCNAIIW